MKPDIVPPHDKRLERGIIGCLILEGTIFYQISNILNEKHFYIDAHKTIFRAIQKLSEDKQDIDIITVTLQLRQSGKLESVGGAYGVSELTTDIASAANIESWIRILHQFYIERELIKLSINTQADVIDPTINSLEKLNRARKRIEVLCGVLSGRKIKEASKILETIQINIDQEKEVNKIPGFLSGFDVLDLNLHGFESGTFTIIAARPGMGKTGLMLNIARNMTQNCNIPAAVFSLEMTREKLVLRLISASAQVNSRKIARNDLSIEEKEKIKIIKFNDRLLIDDESGLSIFDLKAKVMRLKSEYDIKVIFIDYIQLMSGTGKNYGENREREISEISRGLKVMAKDIGIAIIALAQLSREVEKRSSKIPQLSDLRESGSLEQDADNVLFLYRPEYYDIHTDKQGASTKDICEVIIAKNREGKLGTFPLKYITKYQLFENAKNEKTETAIELIF